MRNITPTGRTAPVHSLAELEQLLAPFAGRTVEQIFDSPEFPTERQEVSLDTPSRDYLFPESYLHIAVGQNPPDATLHACYLFASHALPTLREIEGDLVLVEKPGAVLNLLLPSSPELAEKFGVKGDNGTAVPAPSTSREVGLPENKPPSRKESWFGRAKIFCLPLFRSVTKRNLKGRLDLIPLSSTCYTQCTL